MKVLSENLIPKQPIASCWSFLVFDLGKNTCKACDVQKFFGDFSLYEEILKHNNYDHFFPIYCSFRNADDIYLFLVKGIVLIPCFCQLVAFVEFRTSVPWPINSSMFQSGNDLLTYVLILKEKRKETILRTIYALVNGQI